MGSFFNSAFGIWIGGKNFSDGCCRPIRMHKVWRALGIRQYIVEQLSIMKHEVAMLRERVVPRKQGTAALMLELKEAEKKAEAIPLHMNEGHTEKQQPKIIMKPPQ